MKVTSKNGIKLDISPKHWWSIREWIWCFEQAEIIKKQDFYLETKGWQFSYGTISKASK